jgi:hypothetical protein
MLITKKLLTHEASYKSCASAAKLRSGGPILLSGIEAKETVGTPPPRTVIGDTVTSGRTRPKLLGVLQ